MRLFFGLKPDAGACLAIDAWRERMFPPMPRPVPPQNLHLTLAFLGEVDEKHLETLMTQAGFIDAPAFSLRLDQLGYFPRPQVLWIGPRETPLEVIELSRHLASIGRRLALHVERREFEAHLTIARRCVTPPPASAAPPDFDLDFDSFALFESQSIRGGVRYRAIGEWPLGTDIVPPPGAA